MTRLTLALALLAAPAAAQVAPTSSAAADILLSQAIAEHRVFLTCSALDTPTHARILADWQADIASAQAILSASATLPEAITAFAKAADPAALMPAPDAPWEDVQALCATHPDWRETYDRRDFVILGSRLGGALK